MRIIAGILTILGGLIGGTLWRALVLGLVNPGVTSPIEQAAERAVSVGLLVTMITFPPLLIALIGGYYILKRKSWGWALAGAICSILFPFFGIPAVILLVKRKSEF